MAASAIAGATVIMRGIFMPASVKMLLALGSPIIQVPEIYAEPPISISNVAFFQDIYAVPAITAKAYLVQDAKTGQVLLEKNADIKLLPASTTKIATALVALEDYSLDDTITIDRASTAIGHTVNLQVGEQLTVHDVLKALLISSGNDAAVALALHHPLGYQGYIDRMNQLVQQLNLNNTNFANVSGVESPNHYTTARDLSVITAYALKNPVFKDIVATQKTIITSVDGRFHHTLTNLNQLIGTVEGVQGVKTGWTPNAKECLVTYTNRDNNQIIVTVLGSNDRFGESKTLIEWTYANYIWAPPITPVQALKAEL